MLAAERGLAHRRAGELRLLGELVQRGEAHHIGRGDVVEGGRRAAIDDAVGRGRVECVAAEHAVRVIFRHRRARAPTVAGQIFEEGRVEIFLEPFADRLFGFGPDIEGGPLCGQVHVDLKAVALLAERQVEITEVEALFVAFEGLVLLDADSGRQRAQAEANAVAVALQFVLDLDDRAVGLADELAVGGRLDGVVEGLARPQLNCVGRRRGECGGGHCRAPLASGLQVDRSFPVRLGNAAARAGRSRSARSSCAP
jgi:hypothetical protein